METLNCPHCETEIDEHEANKCLDAWVADVVLKKPFRKPTHGTCCTCQHCGDDYDSCGDGCYYSTDIATAWEVVGRMGDVMRRLLRNKGMNYWECIIDYKHVGKAPDAPLAICRAALKAVYVGEDEKQSEDVALD
jgi:hypothetical protein